MADVDNRIVQMVFDNAKFEAGLKQTLGSINQLDEALKKIGGATNLADLQKIIDSLNFAKLNASADQTKQKLNFDGAGKGLDNLEAQSNKVRFGGVGRAIDAIKTKIGNIGSGGTFDKLEASSNRVHFGGATKAVDNLNSKLATVDGTGTFSDLETASSRVNFATLQASISSVSQGFSALEGIAVVALGNIAAKAAVAGAGLLKDLSFGPIVDGMGEYSTNLNSIQTILANTQAQGTNLQDVNKALQELNTYSDQTIYNFSEMAKNIGTFTAAGVDLKTSVASIKGIANLAALSGSNSQQASTAMYQLSQAIAAGKVNLQDWNSVVNAGMGGKVFQKALFDTGKAMHTITNSPVGQTFEQWEKAGNSFRQSLSATMKAADTGEEQLAKAQKDAAKSVQKAQESAAEAVENAQDRVAEAQKGVAEAAKQGAEDTKNAVKAQHDAVEQGAEDVKSAFQSVVEARKRLKEALKPPSTDELEAAGDSVKTAQLDQADLATAVTDAQQDQTRSAQDLAAAQATLAKARASGASPEEQLAAQRAVEDAQKRATDASDAQERAMLAQRAAARGVTEAEETLAEVKKKGTKNDENVKSAQDDLTAAVKNYKDTQVNADEQIAAAKKNVTEVTQQSVERRKAAGKSLADAEKQQAKTIVDSQEAVATATQNATDKIEQTKKAIVEQGPDMGWLTSKVLTSTLKQFTGDMTGAQLKAQGLTDTQVKAVQKTAETAKKAATEVKTLKSVFDVVKESIGSGWANTFQIIFGDFGEAKATFTGLQDALTKGIKKHAAERNKVLADWKELGGRTKAIEALKNTAKALGSVMTPVKEAFREFFPKTTGKSLFEFTDKIEKFTEKLKIGGDTADKIKRTFSGVFAVFKIGTIILGKITHMFGDLFSEAGKGAGGFLNFTANVGDFLVKIEQAIEKGDGLTKFFEGLTAVLRAPLKVLRGIGHILAGLFDGFDTEGGDKVSDTAGKISDSFSGLDGVFDGVKESFNRLQEAIQPGVDKIKEALGGVWDAFKESFSGANYDNVLAGIQTGLFGGLILIIKKFLGDGINIDIGQGVFGKIGDTFDALTGKLKAMQQNVQADTLKKIAVALGLLTASIVALSLIDPVKLTKAMVAVAAGMGQLMAAMLILTKLAGLKGFAAIPLIAAGMILLATAVDVLTIAVAALSRLSWGDLIKGLTGVGFLLTGLTQAAVPLVAAGPGLVGAGTGIIALAIGMRILATAVKAFGDMEWSTIVKGLASVGAALVIISKTVKLFPSAGMATTGLGILLVAGALKLLASAVKSFGDMDITTIAKGLAAITAAMVLLAAAMAGFPKGMIATGTGLLVVSVALKIMGSAIKQMGGISIEKMAKGLITLGASLKILSVALKAMTDTLPGAGALLVAAAALAILAPALRILGGMKWVAIAKGLGILAVALKGFSIAAGLMTPTIGPMLALGGAVLLLGAGLGLAAAGVGVFATGLAALAVSGPAGIAVLMKAISSFIVLLPQMGQKFAEALVGMVVVLAENTPKLVVAMGKIMGAMLQVIINNVPKMGEAFTVLLQTAVKTVTDNLPFLVDKGLAMLLALLQGIRDNIGEITRTVADIIINFIDALGDKLPEIIHAGANFMIKFAKGVLGEVFRLAGPAGEAVKKFLSTIVSKLSDVATAGVNFATKFITGVGSKIGEIAGKGAQAVGKFISGIGTRVGELVDKGKDFIVKLIKGIVAKGEELGSEAARIIGKVFTAVKTVADTIYDEAKYLGEQIVKGVKKGLSSLGKTLAKSLLGPFGTLAGKAADILGINSPSKVFMEIGSSIVEGSVKGIDDNIHDLNASSANMATGAIDSMRSSLKAVPNILDGLVDMDPTITPVLDLTKVQQDAKKLGDMTNVVPITAAASFDMGSSISTEKQAGDDAAAIAATDAIPPVQLNFKQENNSPEALSAIDIYRQTNNGLSQAKSILEEFKKTG